MVYRIGIVGAGHWSRRLYKGLDGGGSFEIHKTVDVLNYDEKKDLLESLNVSRDRHYAINPSESLPDEFFDDLDVVQIASPIKYHHNQTLESLERGKLTITEKSYGASRQEFEEVIDYLEEEGLWNLSYLHLHYLKKLLTIQMPEIISDVVESAGKVKRVEATFIEEESEEDRRRNWLFSPENGGVFLDWIHPIEVLVKGCGASFTELLESDGYLVNEEYTNENPTAAHAMFGVEGEVFEEEAVANIRVGKGFREVGTHKVLRFVFEDSYLDFEYASSEEEFETSYRGEWAWKQQTNGSLEVLDSGKPVGPIPYELLIQDIEDALEGKGTPLGRMDVMRMYEPVWGYNEKVDLRDPIRDKEKVHEFAWDAVDSTSDAEVVSR